jgi:hypothetical protein
MRRFRVLLAFTLPALLLLEYLCFSNVSLFDDSGRDGLRFGTSYSFLPVGDQASRVLYLCQPVLTFPVRPLLQLAGRGLPVPSSFPPAGIRGVAFRVAYPFFRNPLTERAARLNLAWLAVLNLTLQAGVVLLFVRLRSALQPSEAT